MYQSFLYSGFLTFSGGMEMEHWAEMGHYKKYYGFNLLLLFMTFLTL